MSPRALADALARHLLERLPPERAYTRADLDAEALPGPVAALLHRTLDRWLEREREGLRSDWFDFDAPAVVAAGDLYFEALGRTARVPAEAWAETLEGAVWLVVRYLVTPARALTDAVFEGSPDPLPTAAVRRRLVLFEAYAYLPEIADAYLAKRRPEHVDPDTLYGLLARIDRRVGNEADVEEWLRLLGPLFHLTQHVPELDGVPAAVLARFFAAKGEDALAERLEARASDVLDEAALRALLPAAAPADDERAEEAGDAEADEREEGDEPEAADAVGLAEEEEQKEEQTEEQAEAAPEEAPEEEPAAQEETPAIQEREWTVQEEGEGDGPDEPDGEEAAPVPLWQRFATPADEDHEAAEPLGGRGAATEPLRRAEPAPLADPTSAGGDEAEEVPLWRRFTSGLSRTAEAAREAASTHTGTEPRRAAPADSGSDDGIDGLERRVLGRASAARRRRFVRHLFGGDEGAYRDVLLELSTTPTWTEAAQVIARDVFRKHRVDIYGEHAVAFTEAVEGRYERASRGS